MLLAARKSSSRLNLLNNILLPSISSQASQMSSTPNIFCAAAIGNSNTSNILCSIIVILILTKSLKASMDHHLHPSPQIRVTCALASKSLMNSTLCENITDLRTNPSRLLLLPMRSIHFNAHMKTASAAFTIPVRC